MNTEKLNIIINIIKDKKFSCKVENYTIPEARLQIEKGKYYICQNMCDGNRCNDRLGYQYSWELDKNNLDFLSEIEIINDTIDNYLIFT